jgi:hypothetical protein
LAVAACSKGTPKATFTEPPFSSAPTLAPSPSPNGALQFLPLQGSTVVLKVAGFQSGEQVTFTITKPDGTSFTGPPHAVAQDGSVEARYTPPQAGTYTVVAKGDKGDQANGQFTAAAGPTPGPQSSPTATHRRNTATATPSATHHATPMPSPHHTATPHP